MRIEALRVDGLGDIIKSALEEFSHRREAFRGAETELDVQLRCKFALDAELGADRGIATFGIAIILARATVRLGNASIECMPAIVADTAGHNPVVAEVNFIFEPQSPQAGLAIGRCREDRRKRGAPVGC